MDPGGVSVNRDIGCDETHVIFTTSCFLQGKLYGTWNREGYQDAHGYSQCATSDPYCCSG